MKDKEKTFKILKIIIIILLALFIIEAIYFGIRLIINRNNTTYYTTLNSMIITDKNYVGVGLSDYKNSTLTDYEKPGYNKPTVFVYDKNKKLVKEVKYDFGYNGVFNDIIAVDDGYIAVGALEMTEDMHKQGSTEGIIVKYDKDFNIVWKQNLQVLDTTKLVKVKIDKEGNIVTVGQSIYEANIIGNHTTGGAIIVKYNQNGEKLKVVNYGGPKTGIFNDIVVLDNSYVVVGVTQSGTGIIFKYDYNGNEIWHNYYGYTDSLGLTSITKYKDTFIVTGSKLEEKSSTDSYKGAILSFSSNGELLNEQLYKKDKIARLEEVYVDGDRILAIAIYGEKEDNTLKNNTALLEYDANLKLVKEKPLTGKKIVTYTSILKDKDDYLLIGYTNSKIDGVKSNGYDYYPLMISYDSNLKQK